MSSRTRLTPAVSRPTVADPSPKILVVEDEEALADSVRYNLQREGYGVVVATDGRRALERVGDNAVDIGEQVSFLVSGEFREFTDASHEGGVEPDGD